MSTPLHFRACVMFPLTTFRLSQPSTTFNSRVAHTQTADSWRISRVVLRCHKPQISKIALNLSDLIRPSVSLFFLVRFRGSSAIHKPCLLVHLATIGKLQTTFRTCYSQSLDLVLRSASNKQLFIPGTKTEVRWASVQCISSTSMEQSSVDIFSISNNTTFKTKLKTFLFRQAFLNVT